MNQKISFVLIGLIVSSLFIAGCILPKPPENVYAKEIPRFSSCEEIKNVFEASQNMGYGMRYDDLMMNTLGAPMSAAKEASGSYDSTPDYSTTNVQVQGVDEADIVKTDGKYIYVLSNKNLVIAEAWPAETAEILSKTDLGITPQEIFIEGDNILVFGSTYKNMKAEESKGEIYYPYNRNLAVILLIDSSDKENPEIKRTIEFEGSYLNSRKINTQVYFVINSYPSYYAEDDEIIPLYADTKTSTEFKEITKCENIGYLPPVYPESFVTIASIAMNSFDSEIQKTTVVGSAQNIYASQENLYLAQTEYNYYNYVPLISEVVNSVIVNPVKTVISDNKEYTSVHKFSLKDGKIGYLGAIKAPGNILNQFSMDEFEGNFRIATTIGHVSRAGGGSTNNIYIFGEDLTMKGKLEDLAPGEKIYSARFMGKKGYLVTFQKVDPLFVIDLEDPNNPKVLGKLKIPGYSDYLHPIDETHLIGIGKDTIESEQGNFAWYQGIKIAVFDVSDVEHPKEMYKEIIGDRGTDSYALSDHKAFLYDKEKNLLVIPVQLAEITEEQKQAYEERQYGSPPYGEFTFQGAYVYNLSLENGFQLKGRITHLSADDDSLKKSGYYYRGGGTEVKRSLFIGDVLYTISNNKILANSLSDLTKIKELVMAESLENDYPEYY
ncbi:beta-propeller domain-containing protein [Candidatus Micrarchaeota archaeon]|nr:beta-propeller domain-containing protein [Candidatus Micrarchaeota archaeon]MBU2476197.1 beta-propeller domain-containing protein [Candidatus Micrarchaeota archaeon]